LLEKMLGGSAGVGQFVRFWAGFQQLRSPDWSDIGVFLLCSAEGCIVPRMFMENPREINEKISMFPPNAVRVYDV